MSEIEIIAAANFGKAMMLEREVVRLRAINADLLAALELLAADVRGYPAWERPCHALDVAEAAIAKAKS